MDYELAKKLKDGGFPQNGIGCDYPFVSHSHEDESQCVIEPTLSELIESCGDEFSALHKTFSGWLSDGNGKTATGKTPEEAVARLWLSLNNK